MGMLRGFVDLLTTNTVAGWAYNPIDPSEHLLIEVRKSGEILDTFVAGSFRNDLSLAGIGDGDHSFDFKLSRPLANLDGVVICARSAANGHIELPIASGEDQLVHKLYDALVARYDHSVGRLTEECDRLRSRLDELRPPQPSGSSMLPDEIVGRLAAIESRLEAAEVFFVRIDETVRRLSEENKQRRRRFLGIF